MAREDELRSLMKAKKAIEGMFGGHFRVRGSVVRRDVTVRWPGPARVLPAAVVFGTADPVGKFGDKTFEVPTKKFIDETIESPSHLLISKPDLAGLPPADGTSFEVYLVAMGKEEFEGQTLQIYSPDRPAEDYVRFQRELERMSNKIEALESDGVRVATVGRTNGESSKPVRSVTYSSFADIPLTGRDSQGGGTSWANLCFNTDQRGWHKKVPILDARTPSKVLRACFVPGGLVQNVTSDSFVFFFDLDHTKARLENYRQEYAITLLLTVSGIMEDRSRSVGKNVLVADINNWMEGCFNLGTQEMQCTTPAVSIFPPERQPYPVALTLNDSGATRIGYGSR